MSQIEDMKREIVKEITISVTRIGSVATSCGHHPEIFICCVGGNPSPRGVGAVGGVGHGFRRSLLAFRSRLACAARMTAGRVDGAGRCGSSLSCHAACVLYDVR